MNPGAASSRRVLVIGLDMGDGVLIRYWSQQGRLPHFASLLAAGTWLDLESTAQVLHTSTWPTFATGTLPGRHGVYYTYQPKPGYQLAQHITPEQYGTPTFWELADQQGCQSIVYDIPETFLAPQFRGCAIFDWGTWAHYGTPCAQPAGLLKQLQARFGKYPLGFEAKQLGARLPEATLIANRLVRSVEYKRATTQWLLNDRAWDLAVVGFGEPHPAGHYLWPVAADTVIQADAELFEPLFNVYAALDKALGAMVHDLPPEVTVLVLSGDGVCPNRCAWHLLPLVLEQLGYLCPRTATGQGAGSSPALLGRVKNLLSPEVRRWVADRLPWWLRDRLGAQMEAANIDWSRTRAFTLPSDAEGCIRINLQGREPWGIVAPGEPYLTLCREIRARLEELTNPVTGKRAVRQVWIRQEIFPGDRQEHLPDLIVTWNPETPFSALASPHFAPVEGGNPDPRPGTHSPYGFLLAWGPGIAPACQGQGHLADVAPTVLHLLGRQGSASMDGKLLTALSALPEV
jgi:predicted AlkP superfamily phosphohydrolase/phosphomutase